MSSSDNQQQHNQSSSQCPECKKKFGVSSEQQQESSQENQRIIIPLRKDMLNNQTSQIQSTLKNLQVEIQNLKKTNSQKDRMIDDLKKELEHKMTHYMLYGQINKNTDEINKLRSQICYGISPRISRRDQLNQEGIRSIFRQESRRIVQSSNTANFNRNYSENHTTRPKIHSSHDNYNTLRKQFMNSNRQKTKTNNKIQKDKDKTTKNQKVKQTNITEPSAFKQYYENQQKFKQIFKISSAKKKIIELQQKILVYQKQMLWMSNFIVAFIKSMQNLAYKKYQQQIIIPEWSLKKKAKTSWRYMKHIFKFLYEDP